MKERDNHFFPVGDVAAFFCFVALFLLFTGDAAEDDLPGEVAFLLLLAPVFLLPLFFAGLLLPPPLPPKNPFSFFFWSSPKGFNEFSMPFFSSFFSCPKRLIFF